MSDAPLFSADPLWELTRVADYNGDGAPDVVVRHKTLGTAFAWFFDDTTFITDQLIFNVDPLWQQGSAAEAFQKSLVTGGQRPVARPLPPGLERPTFRRPAVDAKPAHSRVAVPERPTPPSEYRGAIQPGPERPGPARKSQTYAREKGMR